MFSLALRTSKTTHGLIATEDYPPSRCSPWRAAVEGNIIGWSYDVTNLSNVELKDIIVTSRQKLPVFGGWETVCTISSIKPGETSSCYKSGTAISGTYKSLVVARAITANGDELEELYDAFYRGEVEAVIPSIKLLNAIYFSSDNKLWIRSEAQNIPVGSADITAAMLVNGIEQPVGSIGWKADKGYYQQVFHGITEAPTTVTLSSDLNSTVTGTVIRR